MLSKNTLRELLGIKDEVEMESVRMANDLIFTLYPDDNFSSSNIDQFYEELRDELRSVGAQFIDYDQAFNVRPIKKNIRRFLRLSFANIIYLFNKIILNKKGDDNFFGFKEYKFFLKRKQFKSGVNIIVKGEVEAEMLPMSMIRSFKDNSIITIVDWPKGLNKESSFKEHFDTSMGLFAYNMSNIILAVSEDEWLLYNFNASHPIFKRREDFRSNLLHSFIPKVYSPIAPLKLSDFNLHKEGFNIDNVQSFISDFDLGAKKLANVNIFPSGKKIKDLPFRNKSYEFIGKMHLDNRNGMSFGFLARQLPVIIPTPIKFEDATNLYSAEDLEKDFFYKDSQLYIKINILNSQYIVEVPEVWVLSQRSGSDKLNMNPEDDLLMLGLVNGDLFLQVPKGRSVTGNFKPSFDTQVILAHALGNTLIASALKVVNPNAHFIQGVEGNGMGIAHWHGYVKPQDIPSNFLVYGKENLHVACSSPQSALYAIQGKLNAFNKALIKVGGLYDFDLVGDLHIEPQHGTNLNYSSLEGIADFLSVDQRTVLGNRYLYKY